MYYCINVINSDHDHLFLQEIVKGLNVTMDAYSMHWRAQIPISNMRI